MKKNQNASLQVLKITITCLVLIFACNIAVRAFNPKLNSVKIVFVTARDEKCRAYTLYQLKQLFDFPIELYMRGRGDLRPDPDVKREYIIDLKEKYNILLCIDDNPDNCKMYNELGLTALEVKKEKESQQ